MMVKALSLGHHAGVLRTDPGCRSLRLELSGCRKRRWTCSARSHGVRHSCPGPTTRPKTEHDFCVVGLGQVGHGAGFARSHCAEAEALWAPTALQRRECTDKLASSHYHLSDSLHLPERTYPPIMISAPGEDAQRSLQLGYKVLLQGLAGGARHNEKEGTVEKFMGERGRWSVKLSTGEPRHPGSVGKACGGRWVGHYRAVSVLLVRASDLEDDNETTAGTVFSSTSSSQCTHARGVLSKTPRLGGRPAKQILAYNLCSAAG
eukprot:3171296-Rhodomonas_salina.3